MFNRLFFIPLETTDSFFIFGPRGTGKTSWLKEHLQDQDHIYIDLLEPSTHHALQAYPERLSEYIPAHYTGRIVIDEIQKVPSLLDEVHRLIEAKKYRFVLTGSSARKLKRHGANLLAGRAIRYTMHPLVIQELGEQFELSKALKLGLLPAVYNYQDPAGYLSTYIDVYMREEIIQEGLVRDIAAFTRFLEVASFLQGQVINASAVARETGIDRQAVKNYFSILYDLLIAHTLPVFSKRAKRKLVATEKFYFFDAGVYQYLRPKGFLDTLDELQGVGLETLFYQSALALIAYQKRNTKVFYWKTEHGVEVDFVLYGEKQLIAVEIKHNRTIHQKMLTGLKHFKEDYPMAKCFVLYLGNHSLYLSDITVLPFTEGLKRLMEWVC
ncbi:MAG: ATPase [Gammaproteobacteria bacterium RIFCSPHIGHO2_12_FULL_42_13]|nr:MAG: ATPase [Gammaproteobacteria bacterium RIFCSPHIGHO2_12_FULL_42_13]